jgi:hypothetical protein
MQHFNQLHHCIPLKQIHLPTVNENKAATVKKGQKALPALSTPHEVLQRHANPWFWIASTLYK